MKNKPRYEQKVLSLLEDRNFFTSAQRLSGYPYTSEKTAKLFDTLVDCLSSSMVCEEEREAIKAGEESKQDIINYELSRAITNRVQPLSSVNLQKKTVQEQYTTKTTSELIDDFAKKYHALRKENIIASEQGLINYVMEYFYDINKSKEKYLPSYHIEKDFFSNKKELKIGEKVSKEENGRFLQEKKNHNLNDVLGFEVQKDIIRTKLINPFKYPRKWESLKKYPEKIDDNYSFIFYGPPGTGKTYFAQALANEINAPFFTASGPDFSQSYHGEGKNMLTTLFNEASSYEKAIIFVDEADTLCYQRGEKKAELKEDVITELLTWLDGAKKKGNIATIFSTNRFMDFDKAIISKIPTENQIYFGDISKDLKKKIIEQKINLYHHEELSSGFIDSLVEKLNNVNPRAIKQIVQSAASYALDEKRERISAQNIIKALSSHYKNQ
jgi:SpoVK/Ycf46/Vps4 family AAA+-type ATPase